jgi:type I restriction enzyme S subunit
MRTVKLGDVCKVVNGGTPKTGVPEYWDGDIFWITPKDLGRVRTRTTEITERKITQSGLDNSSAKVIPLNSVILSTRAPIGHVAINTVPMAFNQGCRGLVPSGEILSEYLYYFLISSKKTLDELGTGTTFRELSAGSLKNIEVPLLSLEEQQRVVERLDAAFEKIDWAIELIEKNIVNSQLLFEKYLRDKMADPEWKTKKLPELATYFNGLTYRPSDVSDNGTIVLRSSNVQNDELEFRDPVRVNCSIKDKLYIETGDILMCSRNGSKRLIGKTAVIGELEERMTFGTFMMIIRSELNPYLIWFFKSSLFRSQLSKGEATQINQVTRYILDDVSVPLPPEKDIALVVYDLQNIFLNSRNLQKNYQKKVQHLLALKQSLLAQVFSQSEVK